MRQVVILINTNENIIEKNINEVLKALGDTVVDIQFRAAATTHGERFEYSVMIVYEKTADSGDKKGE
jgi:hypothetical protein